MTKQRKITAHKPSGSVVAQHAAVPKMIPVGASAIISASLPGLTITPVNVSNSSRKEIKSVGPDMSSTLSGLIPNFSNPEAVTDFSRIYFNAVSNRNIDDVPFNYNRLITESILLGRSPTSNYITKGGTLKQPTEGGKR